MDVDTSSDLEMKAFALERTANSKRKKSKADRGMCPATQYAQQCKHRIIQGVMPVYPTRSPIDRW